MLIYSERYRRCYVWTQMRKYCNAILTRVGMYRLDNAIIE